MTNLHNKIKTSLLVGDIIQKNTLPGSAGVQSSDCITVQEFNYRYFRYIDETSFQCGPTQYTILYLTIKSPSYDKIKIFYDHLISKEDYYYSFLFNPFFPASVSSSQPTLPTYDGGIVVQGYVVNICEEFNSASDDELLMKIEIIIQSITYIGTSENKTKKALILNKI